MNPPLFGILLGLASAATQAGGMLLSRRYTRPAHRSAVRLLVLSHLMIAAVAAALLPIVWDRRSDSILDFALPALLCAGWYIAGQGSLLIALRLADASRVSPLLGLKIVVIAVVATLLLDQRVTPLQWGAVGLCVVAAFLLNYTGGSLPLRVVIAMLITCFCYSMADVYIVKLLGALGNPQRASTLLIGGCLYFTLCGPICLVLLPLFGSRQPRDWTDAAPFAAAWMAATFAFFAAIALAGPVLANIALATRGLFSIALGAAVAALGHHHLERYMPRPVLIRRVIAAALMLAAIVIYQLA